MRDQPAGRSVRDRAAARGHALRRVRMADRTPAAGLPGRGRVAGKHPNTKRGRSLCARSGAALAGRASARQARLRSPPGAWSWCPRGPSSRGSQVPHPCCGRRCDRGQCHAAGRSALHRGAQRHRAVLAEHAAVLLDGARAALAALARSCVLHGGHRRAPNSHSTPRHPRCPGAGGGGDLGQLQRAERARRDLLRFIIRAGVPAARGALGAASAAERGCRSGGAHAHTHPHERTAPAQRRQHQACADRSDRSRSPRACRGRRLCSGRRHHRDRQHASGQRPAHGRVSPDRSKQGR